MPLTYLRMSWIQWSMIFMVSLPVQERISIGIKHPNRVMTFPHLRHDILSCISFCFYSHYILWLPEEHIFLYSKLVSYLSCWLLCLSWYLLHFVIIMSIVVDNCWWLGIIFETLYRYLVDIAFEILIMLLISFSL